MSYSEITLEWFLLAGRQPCVYIDLTVLEPNIKTWAESSGYICKSYALINSIFEETHTPAPCIVQNAYARDFVFTLATIAKNSAWLLAVCINTD